MATFVLIHGAWHGSWCWDRVRPLLAQRGHEVVTPDLSSDVAGSGRDEYLSVVADAIKSRNDAVLVAHSMSGLVAPLAIADPAVTSLVLLAGMMPRPKFSWLDAGAEPFAEPMARASQRLEFDDQGRSTWTPADAIRLFYNDCALADAADAVSRLRADSTAIYGQVMPDFPGRQVPTTYISCRRDQAIDGTWGSRMAGELLHADVRELDTGHSPFWSAPGVLADLLEELIEPAEASR
jgi:pimeloyl-ACP methyl ester carboxylesterase